MMLTDKIVVFYFTCPLVFFYFSIIFIFNIFLLVLVAQRHVIIILIFFDIIALINIIMLVLLSKLIGFTVGYGLVILIIICSACDIALGLSLYIVYARVIKRQAL